MTRIRLKVALVLGGVMFSMVAAELVLRLFLTSLSPELQQILRADPKNYGVVHPYIGYLQRPNNALVISGRDFRAVSTWTAMGSATPGPGRTARTSSRSAIQ